MLFRRFGNHIRNHDWFAVTVDVSVLIIGLMLAFQVDRWWEHRAELAEEREYIDRLIEDVEADIPAIEYAIELQSLRLELADLLMDVAADPGVAKAQPVVFLAAVDQAAFTFTPTLTRHTFEDLRSTGNMDLIRDAGIKRLLYGYHDFDQTQWQYRPLQFDTEFYQFQLAAGVLSDEQARHIQDTYMFLTPNNVEAARSETWDEQDLMAAVARFRSHPPLMQWLHQIRSMQKEAIWVHGRRLENAQALREALVAYRDGIGNS